MGGKEAQVEVQTSESITIENNDASVAEVISDATHPEPSPDTARREKRRLRRNSPHRDKNLNLKVHKNAHRDDLLRTPRILMAYIAEDVSTDEGTISAIIDECMRFAGVGEIPKDERRRRCDAIR